jgi:hypothetical protein
LDFNPYRYRFGTESHSKWSQCGINALRSSVPLPYSLLPLALLVAVPLLAQTPQTVSTPLGNALTIALQASSLTSAGSHPFHIRLHIHEVTDASSATAAATQADIESSGYRLLSGDERSQQRVCSKQ